MGEIFTIILVGIGFIASILFYSAIYRAIACLFRIEKQLLMISQQIASSQSPKEVVAELRAMRSDMATSAAANVEGEFYFLEEQGASQGPFSANIFGRCIDVALCVMTHPSAKIPRRTG